MDKSGWSFRTLSLLFEYLLKLYPPRFRREFASEIRAVFLIRLREMEQRGRFALLTTGLQEMIGLVISILRECWHELLTRRVQGRVPEDQRQEEAGAKAGRLPVLHLAGTRGVLWLAGWTLLTTAVLPLAYFAMPPLAVLLIWLSDRGVRAGLWHAASRATLQPLSFLTSLGFLLASAQWYLLRRFLREPQRWFVATGAGILLGGLAIWLFWSIAPEFKSDRLRYIIAVFLPMGLTLGLAQWLSLRRLLPNAFGIIIIDVLAVESLFKAVFGSLSLTGLFATFFLPGSITGLGMWLLLSQPDLKSPYRMPVKEASRETSRHLPRLAWKGLGLVTLVPLFFGCLWVYAASQLALAKSEGIYPTVEQAVIAINSQGYGGAKVIRIEDVHVGPNRQDGTQPHVWFGMAKVYMDRVPRGGRGDSYLAGSYYVHVREGWVFMPEGSFPEFIGWVMELYHMEGVNR